MFIRKKILIVESIEMDRQFLRHILNNAGYIVETARSPGKAMELLDEDDFDIFFVDIHMPDLGGIKFIKELRALEDYAAVPVLALTSVNPESLLQKGKALGITDWVTKPVSPPYVLHLLKGMGMTNKHHAQTSLF